jgi:hypothetical protein
VDREVADDDDTLDRRQPREHAAHRFERVERLAVVVVTIRREQTRGATWPKRSSTPLMPKSGEHEVHTAPRLVVASIAITDSGRFGKKPATRSPGCEAKLSQSCGDASHFGVQLQVSKHAPAAALVQKTIAG